MVTLDGATHFLWEYARKYGDKPEDVCVYIAGTNGGYVDELMEKMGEDYTEGAYTTLNYLESEDVITVKDGKIEITNRQKLDEIIADKKMVEDFLEKLYEDGEEIENRLVNKDILKYLQEENFKIRKRQKELRKIGRYAWEYLRAEKEPLEAKTVNKVLNKIKEDFPNEHEVLLQNIITKKALDFAEKTNL